MIYNIRHIFPNPIGQTPPKKTAEEKNANASAESAVQKLKSVAEGGRQSINELFEAGINGASTFQIGLSKLIPIQDAFNKQIVTAATAVQQLESNEAKLTSTFKLGTRTLTDYTKAYDKYVVNLNTTNSNIVEYRKNINALLPLQQKSFKQLATQQDGSIFLNNLLASQEVLKTSMKMDEDQIRNLMLYSAGSDKSLGQQIVSTAALAESLKDIEEPAALQYEILSEVANLSADVSMQYKSYPGNLELAVLKARALGTNMETVFKSGKKLLNIEQSVSDELTYQLLSGQRLVKNGKSLTEEYRKSILSGDADKSVQALNDVLESQSNILESNNWSAKEQLATTLDMSQAELMIQYKKLKLKKQTEAAGGKDITGELINMSDAAIKQYVSTLKKASGDLTGDLKQLRDSQKSQESPAEKTARILQSIQDRGLNVHITNEKLNGSAALNSAIIKQMSNVSKTIVDEWVANQLGKTQGIQSLSTILTNTAKEFSGLVPVFNKSLGKLIDSVDQQIKKVLGAKDAVVQVNDGIIKFHDKDKLTVIASPYGSMNERVADKITGNTQSTSIDTNSIVNAIQYALSNVNISVAIDPTIIANEIKFRSGRINNIG